MAYENQDFFKFFIHRSGMTVSCRTSLKGRKEIAWKLNVNTHIRVWLTSRESGIIVDFLLSDKDSTCFQDKKIRYVLSL